MKIQELRIGNLLKRGEIECEVVGLYFDVPLRPKVILSSDSYLVRVYIDEIQPIPLTEEWLRKFKMDGKIWDFFIYGDNSRGFHISTGTESWIFIDYVHQLQNIYFELTGNELIKKPRQRMTGPKQ